MADKTFNSGVTIAKAIAIILMVLGHSGCPDAVNHFLGLMRMPLFFLMSGYCFKAKYLTDGGKYLRRRVTGVYVPYGTLANVFAANRDSAIAVAATLGTRSTGILVSFRNSSNGSTYLVLRRGNTDNQIVLTENTSTTPLITVNNVDNADTDYHLYVMNILSSGVDLYVDGEFAGTTATTPRASSFACWQIGSRHGGATTGEAKYSGLIDDIRVYASALNTDQMTALGQSLGIISPIKILPIPEQVCTIVDTPKPGFTVTNVETGAFWDFGEGGVASGETPFDVAYSFTNGYGTVTVTGKAEGEYEGEMVKRNYKLNNELLVNGGFESGDWAPGWTASGNYAKIDTSSSAYGPNQTTTFISGRYCAILQKQNVATQVFTNDSPYCAELSWKCKQRSGYSGVPYEVTIDGNRIFYEDFPTSTSEVHYRTVEDVVLPPGESRPVVASDAENCIYLLQPSATFTYWVGAGWTGAGRFRTPDEWFACVRAFAQSLR